MAISAAEIVEASPEVSVEVSVVMPCYNAAATIALALEALSGQTWRGTWELIVADNGSTDCSMETVRTFEGRIPGLRIVDAGDVRGPSHAYNAGARAAAGRLLLFCDADDAVADGWLAAMVNALQSHVAVGGSFEPELLNPGWVASTRQLPQQQGLQSGFAPLHLPHIGSGNAGFLREVFDDVGGFREDIPVFGDTDLSWRLQLKGFALHFAPEAVVHVRLRSTMHGIYSQARAYGDAEVRLLAEYGGFVRALRTRRLVRVFVLGWGTALLALFQVHDRSSLGRFMWVLGWRVGRAHGWLAYGRHSRSRLDPSTATEKLTALR